MISQIVTELTWVWKLFIQTGVYPQSKTESAGISSWEQDVWKYLGWNPTKTEQKHISALTERESEKQKQSHSDSLKLYNCD